MLMNLILLKIFKIEANLRRRPEGSSAMIVWRMPEETGLLDVTVIRPRTDEGP